LPSVSGSFVGTYIDDPNTNLYSEKLYSAEVRGLSPDRILFIRTLSETSILIRTSFLQEKVNALLGEIDALRNAAVERATKLGVQAALPAAPGGPLVLAPAAPSQAASEGSAFGKC
jgi:hypothetical protein